MAKHYLWTKSRARLQFLHAYPGNNINWLFLPGGPGLGSESLHGLAELLKLPGNSWHVDLPGDGSNTTEDDTEAFSHWSAALIEAVSALPNVILVAHSSGGMFALATPELENILQGLVLMDSAPNAGWQGFFMNYVNHHPLPDIDKLQHLYDLDPSNEKLKSLTIACAPYFSAEKSQKKIVSLFETLPFNYRSHLWSATNFDTTYQAKWIPKTIPALIFAGEQDILTPLKLFLANKDFQRENIIIRAITDSSHFPWFENPQEVKQIFEEYYQALESFLAKSG